MRVNVFQGTGAPPGAGPPVAAQAGPGGQPPPAAAAATPNGIAASAQAEVPAGHS
jgi:hypothetical protein